ncbi:MAG: SnoaL-like domain [Solirubrobacteraceae bacterium]|nr:SnoaL-like domain [Solirubrobacteraceae bacterium]MEA2290221.1 SnoaL-like domain [Solirubrobacteraceae bacterium]
MSATDAVTQDARAVAHRFIDALNARDLDALLQLVTDDAELRRFRRDPLHGRDGARTLLGEAEEDDLRFVPLRGETVEARDDHARVTLPVRELIGPDDIERVVEFVIRDGRVAAFAVHPMA